MNASLHFTVTGINQITIHKSNKFIVIPANCLLIYVAAR